MRTVRKVERLLMNLEALTVRSCALHVEALSTERSSVALRLLLRIQAGSVWRCPAVGCAWVGGVMLSLLLGN